MNLNKENVTRTIIELAKKELKKPIDVDRLEASLVIELGVDSLELVELIMAVEKKFCIQFPDFMNKDLNSLDDFIKNTISLSEKSSKNKTHN